MARRSTRRESTREPGAQKPIAIALLEAPEYTSEEHLALIDFVLALRKSHVQGFLKELELPKSGTRAELRDRIQKALDDGRLTTQQLIDFIDAVAPWGKQHVFLYTGPRGDVGPWKAPDKVLQRLKRQRLGHLFNARLPLIIPDKLTLSSITHIDGRLRITAVQKSEYAERVPEYDETKTTNSEVKILLKAYMHHVSRTLVAFEWDLTANVAMLQITQLKSDMLYEEMAKEFFELVGAWLDKTMFAPVDVRSAIQKLHELSGKGQAEARFHVIDYRTLRGSRLSAISASPRDSVLADDVIDSAMNGVAKSGVGHLGNFYWLAGANGSSARNPLKADVHVFIVGSKHRINFPTPNTEEVVRYVLQRVRALS